MNLLLIIATTTITFALLFYTIGVWSERKAHTLKPWHVIIFWMGLICDTTGTLIMGQIAKSKEIAEVSTSISLHGITGALAIGLMIFHALWATIVLIKKDDKTKENFHRFSIIVWVIWLIPYFIGMVIGMM